MTILGTLASIIASALVSVGFLTAPVPANLGVVSVPGQDALVDTYLAAPISSSATSLTLADGTTRDGATLSGYYCFTLDVNTPQIEYVCGTAAGTAVSSLSRGVKMSNPNATSTTLAFSHRRFASAQITDFPANQLVARKINGTDTIPNTLQYDTTVATTTVLADPRNLVNVATLTVASSTGCLDASTSVRGCIEAATTAETILGTGTGGTGALLFPQNSLFSPTSTATTIVPLTNTSGKLSQLFQDLTASWSFSGGLTSSATTTLSGASTVISSVASSSVLVSGGSGALSGVAPSTSGNVLTSNGTLWTSRAITHNIGSATANITTAATSTIFDIPSTVGSTVVVNCGVDTSGNNSPGTYSLKLGATTFDACSIDNASGDLGNCALNAAFVSVAATSTVYGSSTNVTGSFHCSYFTL